MKHKMLRIEPRLAFINGVLLANRVLIFRFQLLAVYVLLVHSCGECRIETTTVGVQVEGQCVDGTCTQYRCFKILKFLERP
jgi:hypothetical protein